MFKLPDLPYNYNALEPHIDEETMRTHHDKHHAAYVDNLNAALKGHDDLLKMNINELICHLDQVPEEVRTKVRNNGGGHANHSLFWELMNPKGGGKPVGVLATAIKKDFGNFEDFQKKFEEAGIGRFGSGWVWLIAESGKLVIMSTPNQDSPKMEHKTPILGVDVWEHAYYLKYQNRRAEYLKAWWNTVNWKKVEEIYQSCQEGEDCECGENCACGGECGC